MKETIKKEISENIDEAVGVDTEKSAVEKPYKFRALSSRDMFLMFKIISKIGINEFVACFGKEGVLNIIKTLTDEEKKNDTGEKIAFAAVALEFGNVILKNIEHCEHEIYKLLSQTSNLTVEEITAEGNAVLFFEMLIDFVKKDEFPDFIEVVSRLRK